MTPSFLVPVPTELESKIAALDAVASFDALSESRKGAYMISVFDTISKRTYTENRLELVDRVIVRLPISSRKLRVRVHRRFTFRRRNFTVTVRPPFSVLSQKNGQQISFDGRQVATALNFQFNVRSNSFGKPKVRKLRFRFPVGKPLRPNPESVVGFVPSYILFGDGTFQVNSPDPVTTFYREYSSTRTPGYARLAALGKLPINAHTSHIIRRYDYGGMERRDSTDNPPANSFVRFRSYFAKLGTSDYGPALSAQHLTAQRNKAISRLQSRATGDTANLSETLATMNKTFDMIGGNARRIASAFTAVKKLNFSAAADILWANESSRWRRGGGPSKSKSLANNWLEFQYGWKPLLNDIHYAIEAIGKLVLPDPSVGSIRSSANSESREIGILRGQNGDPDSPECGYWIKSIKTTSRFGLRYKLSSPLRAFAAQSGFTNPVSLAWELLPFSFVLDWFLPVGPYLESLDSWGGLVFLDGWETTFSRVEYNYYRHYIGKSWPGGDYEERFSWWHSGRLDIDEIILTRTKLSSFPSLGFPDFKNPLSVGHALNGIALLITTLSKH
jgi:hypothetical protein